MLRKDIKKYAKPFGKKGGKNAKECAECGTSINK